jgi:hypothetical protein
VIAVAFAAAIYIHQRHTEIFVPAFHGGLYGSHPATTIRRHPSWEDPVAVLIAIGGIAIAVGIIAFRNPRFANLS